MALVASVPAFGAETVPVPNFNAVGLRGGGSVVLVPGATQRVTILDGSSQFTHIYVKRGGSLEIDACGHNCPQHYRLRVEVQTPRVPTLAVDGGGDISVAAGFPSEHDLTLAVNGGGKIDTRAVNANEVTAAVNGGGDLFVRAAARLTGAVRGGGSVRYWGNPDVTSAVEGGGSIRPGY
jgi:hypothetical protein